MLDRKIEKLEELQIKSYHWLNRYKKLIMLYENHPHSNECERHHILPSKVFPEYKKEKWNIVSLPFRVHYLAHYCLYKAVHHKKITSAFICMNTMNKSYTKSRLYHLSRLQISALMSERMKFSNLSDEEIKKRRETIKKTHQAPGRRENISKAVRAGEYKRKPKFIATVMTVQESGKRRSQEIAEKSAGTMRENGHYEMLSEKRKLKLTLYDNNDNIVLKFGSKRELIKWCKEHNIPHYTLIKTYNDNSKVSTHIRNQHSGEMMDKIQGWYVRKEITI